MSKPTTSTAPVTFLIGASTTGKTTIYNEIAKQDQALPEEKRLNWQLWGFDQAYTEGNQYLGGLLSNDNKFEDLKQSLSSAESFLGQNEQDVFGSIISGALYAYNFSPPPFLSLLDDEKFKNDIDDFMQKTGEHYDRDALETLKSLAQENPNDFRSKADLTIDGKRKRMFDHIIENSLNGLPTVFDFVPDQAENEGEEIEIVSLFKEYVESKGLSIETQTVVLGLPLQEMGVRILERNRKAQESGGDKTNERVGIFPLEQSARIFGKNSINGMVLEKLELSNVLDVIETLGGNIESENSKNLLQQLGFEGEETSITIGPKVKTDAFFDHFNMSTAEIAGKIRDRITQVIQETHQQIDQSHTSHQDLESQVAIGDPLIATSTEWADKFPSKINPGIAALKEKEVTELPKAKEKTWVEKVTDSTLSISEGGHKEM